MVEQLSKFTDQLADAAKLIGELLSTKNKWIWTVEHEITFKKFKEHSLNHNTLHLYDTTKPKWKWMVASWTVSAIVYQQHDEEWFPVLCAPRFLLTHKRNYISPYWGWNVAVSCGCRKMHLYLHGLPHFKFQTDHKPLVPILNSKRLLTCHPGCNAWE